MIGDNSSDFARHFFNVISLMILFYMCHCTYFGLFDLKISSFYAIYSHQQTDDYSLLFAASYMAYLATPLCMNFCTLMNIDGLAFHEMIGAMDPIPFIGSSF